MNPPVCPKCSGAMEDGFIADFARRTEQSTWVKGEPEEGFLIGLRVSDRTTHKVRTVRCVNCGFLESYAR
jgi:hypothetical protein